MKTLFEGVYLLEGDVGDRPLQLIYLKGDLASLLLDTGAAGDPARFIVPQIREAGGTPEDLRWIVNTHPDYDHTGGNFEIKRMAPGAILACPNEDRAACSSPEALIRLRYDAYRARDQIYYSDSTLEAIRELSGREQKIELTLAGGEHIRLGDDWEVEVLHVPGHSRGHLALWDRKHNALYGADAIHGSVYLGFDGQPKLPPTYLHVDDYLSTIRFIENLPVNVYVGCHWPVLRGNEIRQFCTESRDFVEHAEDLLVEFFLESHTLREACLSLGPQLGGWSRDVDVELVYALRGHVDRLLARGRLEARQRIGEPSVTEYALLADRQ